MEMEIKNIIFLKSTFGNAEGDIVSLFYETEDEIFYYDSFGISSYLSKSLEGKIFSFEEQ